MAFTGGRNPVNTSQWSLELHCTPADKGCPSAHCITPSQNSMNRPIQGDAQVVLLLSNQDFD